MEHIAIVYIYVPFQLRFHKKQKMEHIAIVYIYVPFQLRFHKKHFSIFDMCCYIFAASLNP